MNVVVKHLKREILLGILTWTFQSRGERLVGPEIIFTEQAMDIVGQTSISQLLTVLPSPVGILQRFVDQFGSLVSIGPFVRVLRVGKTARALRFAELYRMVRTPQNTVLIKVGSLHQAQSFCRFCRAHCT